MKPFHRATKRRTRQSGFTLVEMMVALAISLVVVLGFSVTFVGMKRAFLSQDGLTQLQDNERLAMALFAGSVQQAGYYPNPLTNDRSTQLPADSGADSSAYAATAMAAGQALAGVAAAGTSPEYLATRYASTGTDTLMNCVGGTFTGFVRNVFFVDASSQTLGCVYSTDGGASWKMDGTKPYALVSGVQSMSVRYAVDVDGDGNIDTFLAPASVSAAQWAGVKAVRITLNFVDPVTAGKTITWVQTVNLMNNK